MKQMLAVVSKNLKLLLRSKISALIIIFGPLLLTIFVGLAFNNTTLFNLKVGAYSPSFDNLTESFLVKLEEQDFSVTRFNNQEDCVESIKQGGIHACMVFPEDIDLSSAETDEITFYVDNSRVNIVYTIMDTISAGISSRTKEISSSLVQVLVDTLTTASSQLDSEESNLVKLVEQNEVVRQKQDEIDAKLNILDLSVDSSDFQTATMESTYNARLSDLNSMSSAIGESVNSSKNMLGGCSNSTGLEDELDDIQEEVDDLDLNGTKWTSLTTMFNDLGDAVGDVNEQLTAASSARSSITGITGSVKTTLDNNLNTVMSVKGSVNDITDDIDAIEVTDVSGIVTPISTKIEPVASRTFISYLYPSLVTLLIMFTTVLLGSTMILNEKRSKAFFRNLVSPIKGILFAYSTYVTVMIVLLVQLMIVFALSHWVLKIDVLSNVLTTLLHLFVTTTLFTLIGITIGNIFNSEETSALAAVSASSIMLFISNMILPLESMPLYIQEIARFNPFVIAEQLLRESILFQVSLSEQLTTSYFTNFIPAFYLLLIYTVLLFLFLQVIQSVAQRFFIFRHVLGLSRRHEGGSPSPPSSLGVATQGSVGDMLEIAQKNLEEGNFEEAKDNYIAINEAYTRLSKPEKKQFYQDIVDFKEKLDKAAGKGGDVEEGKKSRKKKKKKKMKKKK